MSVVEALGQLADSGNDLRCGENRMIVQGAHGDRGENDVVPGLADLTDVLLQCPSNRRDGIRRRLVLRERLEESSGVIPARSALNQMASSPAMIRSSSPLTPSNTASGRPLWSSLKK